MAEPFVASANGSRTDQSVAKQSLRNGNATITVKRIVTPIPENLASLKKEEERIAQESMACIELDRGLYDHVSQIQEALNLAFDFTHVLPARNEDDMTIKFIGARLFNSAVSAFRVMLSGYYQSAASLVRDLFEINVLLDYFYANDGQVTTWRHCTPARRIAAFKVKQMLTAIHQRDAVIINRRYRKYRMLCEYAVHPTYRATKMIAVDGLVKIGPFFKKEYLEGSLVELALNVSRATFAYCRLFKATPREFGEMFTSFSSAYKKWFDTYSTLHRDSDEEALLS